MSELRRAGKSMKVRNGEIEHVMDGKKKSSYHKIGRIGRKMRGVTASILKLDEIHDKFKMRKDNFEF